MSRKIKIFCDTKCINLYIVTLFWRCLLCPSLEQYKDTKVHGRNGYVIQGKYRLGDRHSELTGILLMCCTDGLPHRFAHPVLVFSNGHLLRLYSDIWAYSYFCKFIQHAICYYVHSFLHALPDLLKFLHIYLADYISFSYNEWKGHWCRFCYFINGRSKNCNIPGQFF